MGMCVCMRGFWGNLDLGRYGFIVWVDWFAFFSTDIWRCRGQDLTVGKRYHVKLGKRGGNGITWV